MGRPPRISRNEVLECARRTFAAKGFEATTLADIAHQLGVTPAAILRHFDSKQALFRESMRSTWDLPPCVFELRDADAASDPRVVLRTFAEQWVQFAQKTIAQSIALQLHERSQRTLVLPFEPGSADSPPRRGFPIVVDYFRRAKKAGVICVGDLRAAALMFMSSLVGYVFIHEVVQATPEPYPLPAYIDALIDLWSHGGIATKSIGGSRARRANHPAVIRRAAVRRRRR